MIRALGFSSVLCHIHRLRAVTDDGDLTALIALVCKAVIQFKGRFRRQRELDVFHDVAFGILAFGNNLVDGFSRCILWKLSYAVDGDNAAGLDFTDILSCDSRAGERVAAASADSRVPVADDFTDNEVVLACDQILTLDRHTGQDVTGNISGDIVAVADIADNAADLIATGHGAVLDLTVGHAAIVIANDGAGVLAAGDGGIADGHICDVSVGIGGHDTDGVLSTIGSIYFNILNNEVGDATVSANEQAGVVGTVIIDGHAADFVVLAVKVEVFHIAKAVFQRDIFKVNVSVQHDVPGASAAVPDTGMIPMAVICKASFMRRRRVELIGKVEQRFLVLDGDGACIAIVTIEIAVSIFLNQKTGGHNGRILGILVPSHFADGPNAAASRSFHGLIVRREESAALIVVAVFRVVAIECAAGDDNAGNRFTILHVQRQRLQA